MKITKRLKKFSLNRIKQIKGLLKTGPMKLMAEMMMKRRLVDQMCLKYPNKKRRRSIKCHRNAKKMHVVTL